VTLALISASMLTAVLFILPESRGADRSVSLAPQAVLGKYWNVVKQPAFIVYGLAGGFTLGSLFAYVGGSPFIYMEKFHFTQTQYGLLFSLNSLGYIGGSQVNRYLLKRAGSLRIAEVAAIWVAVLGFLMVLSAVLPGVSGYVMLVLLFLFLFGSGLLGPNTMALALEPFSENAGSASALIGFTQMLFGALASALVSVLHDQTALPMTGVMALCAGMSAALIVVQKMSLRRKAVLVKSNA
jgi:MFS transporter, DHA1 family, multidrug resistance protein